MSSSSNKDVKKEFFDLVRGANSPKSQDSNNSMSKDTSRKPIRPEYDSPESSDVESSDEDNCVGPGGMAVKSSMLNNLKKKKSEQMTRDPEATMDFERSQIKFSLDKILKKKEKLMEERNINKEWILLLMHEEQKMNAEGKEHEKAVKESIERRERDLLALEKKKQEIAEKKEKLRKMKEDLTTENLEFEQRCEKASRIVEDVKLIKTTLDDYVALIGQSQM